MLTHAETPIKRHIKVKGAKSPYDGDWAYWANRMSNGYGGIPTKIATLMKRQKGRCAHCGQYFTSEDLWEIDQIQPKVKGGKDYYSNLQLLHRHCHDIKTRLDGSNSTHDNG
jgi:RNA-directed DNA polymerase